MAGSVTSPPFHLPAQPFEALDGYLDRVGHISGWPRAGLLRSVGVTVEPGDPPLVIALRETQARPLASWMRSSLSDVHRMTIAGHLGLPELVATSSGSRARTAARLAARLSFQAAGSSYCPECLCRGHWDVRWRSRLYVACNQHRRSLIHTCPSCGGIPRTDRRETAGLSRLGVQSPEPHTCQRSIDPRPMGAVTEICRADLRQAPAEGAVTDELLHSQEWLSAIPETATATSRGSSLGKRLEALCLIALVARQAEGRSSPAADHRALVGRALPEVVSVLVSEDVTTASERLTTLLQSQDVPIDRMHLRRAPTERLRQVFERCLAGSGRVSTRLSRSHGTVLPLYPVRTEQIPQRMWPCSMPTTLSAVLGKPSEPVRQAFMSLCVARIVAGTWEEAAAALAFPPGAGRRWSKYVVEHLTVDQRRDTAAHALRLATAMSRAPKQSHRQMWSTAELRDASVPTCAAVDPKGWCPCLGGADEANPSSDALLIL